MANLNDFDLEGHLNNNNNNCMVQSQIPSVALPSNIDTDKEQIMSVVSTLVSRGINITETYSDYLNTGFALANGMGEEGRTLFHDLSSMSSKYNAAECDKQYNHCLRSHGSGITIKTLFHMAKNAGVDISEVAREAIRKCAVCADAQPCANTEEEHNSLIINERNNSTQECASAHLAQTAQNSVDLSFRHTFSDKIQTEDWCGFMKPILDSMTDFEGKDKMVLGAMNVLSGAIPNYYSVYGGHVIFPPFYQIFYGPAACRKGEIRACLELIKPLKLEIRRQYEYELEHAQQEHAEWESRGGKGKAAAERGPEPKEPEFRSPIIAANSSASAAYLALKANGGWGVMFETEADVITQSLLSDYGDYSTGLRSAYHHEPITLNRVKDKLHIEIEEPRLAVGVTCTPGQLPKLFPSFENGLGSRFMFYGLNRKVEWLNPFLNIDKPLDEVYEEQGKQFLDLFHEMSALGERRIQFMLTDEQKAQFNGFFSELLMEQFSMLGDGISSFVFRLGLSTFRMAMILALLRRFSDWDRQEPLFAPEEQAIACSDKDFHIAMAIVNCLVNHTAIIYSSLATNEENPLNKQIAKMSQPEQVFFKALPDEYTSKQAAEVAKSHDINTDTARRYLSAFVNTYKVSVRVKNGCYAKVINKDFQTGK